MDWETELAKEMLTRAAADGALEGHVRFLRERVRALESLGERLEAEIVGLAREALQARQVVEEGATVFLRAPGEGGPWIAVRETVVDLRDGDRSVRVPAWLLSDGKRFWSLPHALLTTSMTARPAQPRALTRFVGATLGWLRRLLTSRASTTLVPSGRRAGGLDRSS